MLSNVRCRYIKDLCFTLRFPQDYNYHIQNFSVAQYNSVVKSRDEASLHYVMMPADVFPGRSLCLVVNVAYHDAVSSGCHSGI